MQYRRDVLFDKSLCSLFLNLKVSEDIASHPFDAEAPH
jgi:hypothetical protein